jgi:hypothetical protein
MPSWADDKEKKEEVKVLTRADLKNLEGVWEMNVSTKMGWKGTIRATIKMYAAGTKEEGFGAIRYDYDLVRGAEKSSIRNAPGDGIEFAGVSRGKNLLLVTMEREPGIEAPFKVKVTEELTAPITLSGDKLQVDVSKSKKHFCFPMTDFDLEWNRLEFTRRKKD